MKYLILVICLLSGLSFGCGNQTKPPVEIDRSRSENIEFERIFMQDDHNFIVMVKDGTSLKTKGIHIDLDNNGKREILFKLDVPPDKSKWVELSYEKLFNNDGKQRKILYPCRATFHLVDLEELGGGEWKKTNGKNTTTGKTTVIQ